MILQTTARKLAGTMQTCCGAAVRSRRGRGQLGRQPCTTDDQWWHWTTATSSIDVRRA